MGRIRRHLTYANVISTLCLFLLLGGGSAIALSGTNTVFTDDIVNDQVKSADVRNDDLAEGGLGALDLRAGSVGSSEVQNGQIRSAEVRDDTATGGGLTGTDIQNQSGVDTCTHGTVRLGELCYRTTRNAPQMWHQAVGDCASLDLRLPSYSEAVALAVGYDLPNVNDQELFWTGEYWQGASDARSWGVQDGGGSLDSSTQSTYETICVTTPTN